MLTDIARRIFEQDRFAMLTGISIEQVVAHQCLCTLHLDHRHRNARGVAMGGVLFTLADFAAAVAANSAELTDGQQLHWVSLDATIHYLSPATCQRLTARCTAVKHGRTTALYRTEIADPDTGRTLAVAETTMVRTC